MAESEARRYFPKMVGTRCYLSPISLDDAATYTAWLNDLEVMRTVTVGAHAVSLSREREILERLAKDHTYAIVEAEHDRLIGNCGLLDIDNLNGTCEIGIFIGDKEYWGRGFGPEAMALLLDYAFDYLNMRNIWLQVYEFNTRGVSAYKKLGFREVGRRRKALRREGAEHDVIFMDILDEEFRALRKGA
ncbi:MAG: GNAT family N-acetyltransferase [Spirochaetales bacterium]|nr:GNAT family N-acetyltransferase [Spirochaetales bacterium]